MLRGGQGVFGIAVSGAMKEISGSIKDFPVERADGGTVEDARGRAPPPPSASRRSVTRRSARRARGCPRGSSSTL